MEACHPSAKLYGQMLYQLSFRLLSSSRQLLELPLVCAFTVFNRSLHKVGLTNGK